ncbi:uncharacterized protein LOC119729844 [Patiria miniata]|uniref:Uncharacterized protein n=1 Tax=Patiria miniata TaxID=46514 RepID=A0A914A4E7_PATMI|nr:uncharacterized protein LOC119729844 [Patiria miniata]
MSILHTAEPNDGGDTLLSDAVHNPALTSSVSDDSEPDETDVGYENPGKMTTSLQPDPEMQYDYAAVSRPAVELVVNSGNKNEGYVNSTMTSKIVAKDKPEPEQTNRQTVHPDDDDKRLDDTSGQSSNYVYDYAAIDNLPVGKGLSLGSHNKSPPNQSNREPPMVHPAPPATDPGRPDSKYDDVAVGNNSDQLVVDVEQDRAYVNQKVFAKRRLGEDKQAPKRSDAGTECSPSDRSQQPVRAFITARDPPVPTDDAYAYAEIPSIVTNPSPRDSPPACYESIAPGQSPLSDGGYQALNPAGLEGENKYTPLILEK